MNSWDYIIVGAGSAGCVLANRLSADGTARVLLVEAGGADRSPYIHVPAAIIRCVGNPSLDWVSLAHGHGVPGVRVDHTDALAKALRDGFASGGPVLIEVLV